MNKLAWHEGDVCHKLRRLCGWTVEKLAEEAGVTTSVIHRLESGRTKEPKRYTLTRLATAFRLSSAEDFRKLIPSGTVPMPRAESGTRRAGAS